MALDEASKAIQSAAITRGFVGRPDAVPDTSSPASMLRFLYPARTARQSIDTATAAKELGVSPRTVLRWVKGESRPKPASLKSLTSRAKRAPATKKWRARVSQAARNQIKTEAKTRTLKIHGVMGPSADARDYEYVRERNANVELSPEQQDALYDAWIDGGDEAMVSRLQEQMDRGYVNDWHFHGISQMGWS